MTKLRTLATRALLVAAPVASLIAETAPIIRWK